MNNEILFILGASSDIGCELIRSLPREYGKVIAHANQSKERLQKLEQDRPDLHIQSLQADLADFTQTQTLMTNLKAMALIPTQVVHLPASPLTYRRLRDMPWDIVQREIDIQCRSLFLLFQAFLPQMAAQKRGKVVALLSNVTMDIPPPYLTHYIVAKEALLGLVRAAAAEFGQHQLFINAVSPGMVNTRFIAALPEAFRDQEAQRMPLKRLIEPAEVVSVIRHLLSEDANALSGQNVPVILESQKA